MSAAIVAQALAQIIAAEMPADTEPIIIRLLNDASLDNGQANKTWPEYLELCGCTNRNAARRHLTRAKKAGIVHFSTNDFVYVTFLQWLPNTQSRAAHSASARRPQRASAPKEKPECSDSDESRAAHSASARRPQRADALNNDSTYTHAHAQGWVGLGIDLDQDQDLKDPTQPPQPTTADEPAPTADHTTALTDEQTRAYNLLTDPEIGMLPDNAERFARMHTFPWVVRHVFTWWDQREEKGLGPGVLVYRLGALGKSKPARSASDAFRASDFWRRHYPLDATGIRRRRYAIDLAPDPLLDSLPMPIYEEEEASYA